MLSEMSLISDKSFMALLQFKHSQGLLFCMKDFEELEHERTHFKNKKQQAEQQSATEQPLHPFWAHFSQRLQTLHDPFSRRNYCPLTLSNHDLLPQMNQLSMKYQSTTAIIQAASPSFVVQNGYQPKPTEFSYSGGDDLSSDCASFSDFSDADNAEFLDRLCASSCSASDSDTSDSPPLLESAITDASAFVFNAAAHEDDHLYIFDQYYAQQEL
jgi:hypothetical protein